MISQREGGALEILLREPVSLSRHAISASRSSSRRSLLGARAGRPSARSSVVRTLTRAAGEASMNVTQPVASTRRRAAQTQRNAVPPDSPPARDGSPCAATRRAHGPVRGRARGRDRRAPRESRAADCTSVARITRTGVGGSRTSHHGFSAALTTIARISLRQRLLEVPRKPDRHVEILRFARKRVAQFPDFSHRGIVGPDRQALQHFSIGGRDARRGDGDQRMVKPSATMQQTRTDGCGMADLRTKAVNRPCRADVRAS